MVVNTMDYKGCSYLEALRTTKSEYSYLKKVHELREQRKRADIHYMSWKVQEVQQMKKGGKPMYERLIDFYDFEMEGIKARYGNDVSEYVLDRLEDIDYEQYQLNRQVLNNVRKSMDKEG